MTDSLVDKLAAACKPEGAYFKLYYFGGKYSCDVGRGGYTAVQSQTFETADAAIAQALESFLKLLGAAND